MLIAFTLTMPGNNSWNGKWSGDGVGHHRVITFGNAKKTCAKWDALIDRSPFSYSFGDGWVASIAVKKVTASEARRLRKLSQGFCGYDWMIESIRCDGDIYGPAREKPSLAPVASVAHFGQTQK
jgi:hypothetical protein